MTTLGQILPVLYLLVLCVAAVLLSAYSVALRYLLLFLAAVITINGLVFLIQSLLEKYSKKQFHGISDEVKAEYKYLEAKAKAGDTKAQNNIGILCHNKLFRRFDAQNWFELAAAKNNAIAQYNLGVIHSQSSGIDHFDKARKWWRLSAENGFEEAQVRLAAEASAPNISQEDFDESFRWCIVCATRGDADAQYELGLMYENGWNVRKNHKEAAKWYTLAAEHGHAKSQNTLGEMYYKGRGVPRDYEAALKWYSLSANQGNEDAYYNLGDYYNDGKAVSVNIELATKYYRLAAEGGCVYAQLALLSIVGYEEAYYWWTIITKKSSTVSVESIKYRDKKREYFENVLSADTRADIEHRAQLWLDRYSEKMAHFKPNYRYGLSSTFLDLLEDE